MTVKDLRTLVDNLEEYIHVPGGIERLKKTILHLAVSGKLVPQDSSEGTGEELYKQIQSVKQKLIAEGKLKKQKPLPEVNKSEISLEFPDSWKCTRLGSIFFVTKLAGFEYTKYIHLEDSGEIPVIRAQNVRNWRIDKSNLKYISEETSLNLERSALAKESVLVTFIGANIGETAYFKEDRRWHLAPNVAKIENFSEDQVFLPFLNLYLISKIGQDELFKHLKSTAQPSLSMTTIRDSFVLLPPLAEQKRILNKVNTIFKLIDELNVMYLAEQKEREKLVGSSLANLAKGEGEIAFTHLTEIIRTKSDAAQLRKTILHLAVSGQLVPQDPSEGTGEELFTKIQAEKAKLIKEGKIKKQKPLPEISDDEIPFQIPKTWKWARLSEIYRSITPITKVKTTDILQTGEYPVVDQGQRYIAGYVNTGKLNKISKPVTVFGDHTREIKLIDFDFIVGADGVKILEPIIVDSEFLYLLVDVFRPSSRGYGRHFKMLNDRIVPLPTLAEQTRIVQKITQLLDLVNELEKHLEK